MDIQSAIDKAIRDGQITQAQVDALIETYRAKMTIKLDVDNLGEALVAIMTTQADLDARVTALEQAGGGGGA